MNWKTNPKCCLSCAFGSFSPDCYRGVLNKKDGEVCIPTSNSKDNGFRKWTPKFCLRVVNRKVLSKGSKS